MKNLILTGGGSAGHCLPHFAILPLLKNKFDNIYYIGSETGIERQIVESAKIPYFSITSTKLVRSFSLSNFAIPFKLKKAVCECIRLLIELKPSIVFSKGGYVSLPVALAAKRLNIPLIVHESDYTLGLTNKICSRSAKLVLTSFEETARKLKNGKFVGSPIRTELFNISKAIAYKKLGITTIKPIILVFGGSQGSRNINEATREALPFLTKDFYVFHIVGKGNYDGKLKNKDYLQVEFTSNMGYVYSVADVAVSRAGSNSAFELISLKKPTLFIPLSKAQSRGDQILNAEYFEKKNLCKVLLEENLNPEKFIKEIYSLYEMRNELKERMSKEKKIIGNNEIVKFICDYV